MSNYNIFLIIAIASVITFLTRFLPFAFLKNKQIPKFLNKLETNLPPMIMVLLVIYCLKDVAWTNYPYGLSEIFSILLVVILHLWKRNALLSIISGTLAYVIICLHAF